MPIKIRFVTSHDIVSWAIRGAEMGFLFSHAEVVMPDGTLLGAHADGGVEARPWGYDAKYAPIEMLAEIETTDDRIDAFHAFMLEQLGKPYDMAAIEDFALGIVRPAIITPASTDTWRNPDAWFCSELVIAGLEVIGLFPNELPVTPRNVTPRDLVFAISTIATFTTPGPATRPPSATVQARPV